MKTLRPLLIFLCGFFPAPHVPLWHISFGDKPRKPAPRGGVRDRPWAVYLQPRVSCASCGKSLRKFISRKSPQESTSEYSTFSSPVCRF